MHCRLEHFCFYKLNDRQSPIIEKSHHYHTEEVYVEEYYDFNSVKDRILKLNEAWEDRKYREGVWGNIIIIIYNSLGDHIYI